MDTPPQNDPDVDPQDDPASDTPPIADGDDRLAPAARIALLLAAGVLAWIVGYLAIAAAMRLLVGALAL